MVDLPTATGQMADHQQLIGKPWLYGKQDCYTLVRSYFELQGIVLPDFERPEDLETCSSIYLKQAIGLGFKRVEFEERKPGDVAIMKLGTQEPMHAAIFVAPWEILHHMRNRLSGVEWLHSYYVKSIAAVYRYAAGSSAG